MNKNERIYSMKETCELTGLSYDTLKYYCNEGLIPNVKRNKSNYRIFNDNDINWIKNLLCLKNCDMGITEMREYIKLCLIGKDSIPERKKILDSKLQELECKKQEIQKSIDFVQRKQDFYDNVLSGKEKYFSYLINTENDDN